MFLYITFEIIKNKWKKNNVNLQRATFKSRTGACCEWRLTLYFLLICLCYFFHCVQIIYTHTIHSIFIYEIQVIADIQASCCLQR